jgi:hypothetical protein
MTLSTIGQEMKERLAAVEKGHVTKALFGGLMIVLERRGRLWRLALGRTKTPLSITEAQVVAREFGLPAGIEWHWEIKRNQKQKMVYQVAECRWLEDDERASEDERGGG